METTSYEERRALEVEHGAKQARALEILIRDIAKLMPGWQFRPDTEESPNYRRHVLVKDGMTIHLSRDSQKKDRLHIGTWSWPDYTTWNDRGEQSKTSIRPQDLYDPKEDSPSISVAIDRGAEALVKEINRRFLPEYERLYSRCLDRAIKNGTEQLNSREMWLEACRIAGVSPKYNSTDVKTKRGRVGLAKRHSEITLTMDVGLDTLKRILDALNAEE